MVSGEYIIHTPIMKSYPIYIYIYILGRIIPQTASFALVFGASVFLGYTLGFTTIN